jgi:hypothetical protein
MPIYTLHHLHPYPNLLGLLTNTLSLTIYYSKESDASDKPRECAGLLYHLEGREGLSSPQEWSVGEYHISLSKMKVRTQGKRWICGDWRMGVRKLLT